MEQNQKWSPAHCLLSAKLEVLYIPAIYKLVSQPRVFATYQKVQWKGVLREALLPCSSHQIRSFG